MSESDLQRLIDLEAVRVLMAEFAEFTALGDIDRLVELWVPHGSWDMGGGAVHRGVHELRELFLDRWRLYEETNLQQGGVRFRSYDGQSASVTSSLVAFHAARKQDAQLVTWGRYEDEVQLVEGRWLFVSRRLFVQGLHHMSPKDEIPKRFTRLTQHPLPDD